MSPRAHWLHGIALVALFAVALLVRLDGLERRMLCHPENFVPGLDVPAWATSPPPANDLEAVLRRTPMDGHPPLYMLAMLPWERAFGTGLGALRLPSVIFGVLSVVLLWRIGLREGGRWTALLGAALLALNGHNVFWSQMARMYVMAACLCLASTLCLLRLLAHGRRSDEALYVVTTTAAVWTTEFGWPFLFAQLVWSMLESIRRRRPPRALAAQALVLILCLPLISLAVYALFGRTSETGKMTGGFLEPFWEYFGFGHLYFSQATWWGPAPAPPVGRWVQVGVGAVLLLCAAVARPRPALATPDTELAPSALRWWHLLIAALPPAALMAWFGQVDPAAPRQALVSLSVLPLLVASIQPPVQRLIAWLAARPPAWLAVLAVTARRPSLWLGAVPVLLLGAVMHVVPAFTARGVLVSAPFLALAVAGGLAALWSRRKELGATAVALVLALHVASVLWFRRAESSPRDYRGLAARMLEEMQRDDAVLVKDDWRTQPLYYYLTIDSDRIAPMLYERWLDLVGRQRRVWVVFWEEPEPPADMLAALTSHELTLRLQEREATAWLFEPKRP